MRQSRLSLPVPRAVGYAQETLVTAKIIDQFGVPYVNSNWTATFRDGPLTAGQQSLFTPQGLPPNPSFPGSPVTPRQYVGVTDSTGTLSQMLWDNSQIWPPGSYWVFRFSDPSGTLHSEVSTQVLVGRPAIIQGGSVDLSALLSGSSKPIPTSSPRTALPGFAYTVATLPTGEQPGTIAKVNDGINPSDTVVGGGTHLVLCVFNGSVWEPLGGGGTGVAGIVSINGDFSANQFIEGANGITVGTTNGITTVTGPGTGTGVQDIFVSDEVLTATTDPHTWTVGVAPNPPTSLQLYQMLPQGMFIPGLFGAILLTNGIDYTLSGNTVITTNLITAGNLFAWYRYPATTMQPPTYFTDRDIVLMNGNAGALAATPNPAESLQLFQPLPMFGGILLIQNVDYVLNGAAITTYRALLTGQLIAYYRHV